VIDDLDSSRTDSSSLSIKKLKRCSEAARSIVALAIELLSASLNGAMRVNREGPGVVGVVIGRLADSISCDFLSKCRFARNVLAEGCTGVDCLLGFRKTALATLLALSSLRTLAMLA